MTVSDRLSAVAVRLRELAEGARRWSLIDADNAENAALIAALNPSVALVLADLIDQAVERHVPDDASWSPHCCEDWRVWPCPDLAAFIPLAEQIEGAR